MSDHADLRVEILVPLEPAAAFETVITKLTEALRRVRIVVEPGPSGVVRENGTEVGRVAEWRAGERVRLVWRPADWLPETTELELRLREAPGGALVTVEYRGWRQVWSGQLSEEGDALPSWFATEIAAPLLRATAPRALGDWFTDRVARRPSGDQARTVYADPVYHRPNFLAILDRLALTGDEYLLELGCGGGVFLREALRTGCRAVGIDHSADMVQVARVTNRVAVDTGQLVLAQASADRPPLRTGTFDCVVMTGVFAFLLEPATALRECRRVLADGGRLAIYTPGSQMKGTAAAPEPMASRMRFVADEELTTLAQQAGFTEVSVTHPDLTGHAREAGVPPEAVPMFSGAGGQLLFARR
ncbi:MAG: methyltransferase domain-containing protein [Micromonosporaceae bacterium]